MKIVTILAIALALVTTCTSPARADYCRPFVTHTCVVCSRIECRWATDACGRHFSYEVKIVTYRSHYSNGQTTTFSKTYRA